MSGVQETGKPVEAYCPPFHGQTGEPAEGGNLVLVDRNDPGVEDDHPLVVLEHRAKVQAEIGHAGGEDLPPVVDPAGGQVKALRIRIDPAKLVAADDGLDAVSGIDLRCPILIDDLPHLRMAIAVEHLDRLAAPPALFEGPDQALFQTVEVHMQGRVEEPDACTPARLF